MKIGYPDQWIDYGSLVVRDEPLASNVVRAKEFHFERMLARLDKPVDRTRWMMTPQTVNAYCEHTRWRRPLPTFLLVVWKSIRRAACIRCFVDLLH